MCSAIRTAADFAKIASEILWGIGWTGIEDEKGFKIHNINKVTVKQYTKRPFFGFHSVERNCFRMDMNDLQTVKRSYWRRHRTKKRA